MAEVGYGGGALEISYPWPFPLTLSFLSTDEIKKLPHSSCTMLFHAFLQLYGAQQSWPEPSETLSQNGSFFLCLYQLLIWSRVMRKVTNTEGPGALSWEFNYEFLSGCLIKFLTHLFAGKPVLGFSWYSWNRNIGKICYREWWWSLISVVLYSLSVLEIPLRFLFSERRWDSSSS